MRYAASALLAATSCRACTPRGLKRRFLLGFPVVRNWPQPCASTVQSAESDRSRPRCVPEALLARFGKPESAMVLMLEPSRKLARASASAVLDNIQEQGFYLQMPPLPDSEMFAVRVNNQKLEK